jgi:hypothetical protein
MIALPLPGSFGVGPTVFGDGEADAWRGSAFKEAHT